MIIYAISHFIFFWYFLTWGVALYAFIPEKSIQPLLCLFLAIAYLFLDTFIYYSIFKKKGKSKFAKSLFVYDIVVFAYITFGYTFLYPFNIIMDLIYFWDISMVRIKMTLIVLSLPVAYFFLRGMVHKKILGKKT